MKAGQELIIYSARRSGKSVFNMAGNMIPFKKFEEGTVDGDIWYTVGCNPIVAEWVRTQPKEMWYEHIDNDWHIPLNKFDMHEKIYTMLGMRWL